MNQISKRFLLLFVLLLLVCIDGCDTNFSSTYGIISPSLSPDNKKIIFVCTKGNKCDLAVYDTTTEQTHRFNPTNNQECLAPAYSRDGKLITFTSGKGDNRNVSIMNADGSGVRQLTHNYNDKPVREGKNKVIKINGSPSFSPDGKRIIFVRSGVRRQRSMGGKVISNWDVYEVDVASGVERRLTNYKFDRISRPFYLPDGKRFIFTGIMPQGPEEYETPNEENFILVMDGINNRLKPAFKHDTWASQPTVADDGTIVFVSRTNELDGTKGDYTYDLFIRREEATTRLTTMRFSQIAEPFISFDGSRIVFLASKARGAGPALWIANGDGSGLTKIDLPSWDRLNKSGAISKDSI
ncbi:MAG: periplasmic component of the Tol biopolymer transport [Geobacteraceae bacterium]|nr:MAG: periplasmic component of the Tol biopolymer transport [Geobacteraceae bacterium]